MSQSQAALRAGYRRAVDGPYCPVMSAQERVEASMRVMAREQAAADMRADRARSTAEPALEKGKRPGPRSDFGPSIRVNRGDVVKTDGPCPDDPRATVRRGRVICHYDRLHARGGLTDPEREAADLYAVLLEQESGARDRPVVKVGGRTPPWLQGHPAEMQVKAAAKLRKAHEAVGQHGRAMLRRFIEDNQTVTQIAAQMGEKPNRGETAEQAAKRRGMNEQQCLGRIRAALTRLAELWGMEG